jgi:hypothetical protein
MMRSILTEIYLCHTCSCHEILRLETPGPPALTKHAKPKKPFYALKKLSGIQCLDEELEELRASVLSGHLATTGAGESAHESTHGSQVIY